MKVLLSGYYGFDNAGDDAVLFAIVQALRETIPEVDHNVVHKLLYLFTPCLLQG